MACARESDRKKVSDVLKKTLVGNPKHPSPAAETLGSDFRQKAKAKVEAVKDSFDDRILIDLKEATSRKAANKPLENK